MKKHYLTFTFSFLLINLFIGGCKKEETEIKEEVAIESKRGNDRDHDKCQLVQYAQSDGYIENYQYNHRDLVDKISIDYSGQYYEEYEVKYDHKNRKKTARLTSPFLPAGEASNYTFYNDGKFTTRTTVHSESTGELLSDISYTYNRKGQMIREDDEVTDFHTSFYYNDKGFNIRTDFYIGSELSLQFLFKHDIPNRNPFLALNGLDFWFISPFYAFWDKRWNSSATFIFYDNGTPVIYYQDDPAQTVMQTGKNNYITNAQYFDNISGTPNSFTCTFQNCGGKKENYNGVNQPSSAKRAASLSAVSKLKKILSSRSKNLKQELVDLKKEILR